MPNLNTFSGYQPPDPQSQHRQALARALMDQRGSALPALVPPTKPIQLAGMGYSRNDLGLGSRADFSGTPTTPSGPGVLNDMDIYRNPNLPAGVAPNSLDPEIWMGPGQLRPSEPDRFQALGAWPWTA